MAGQSPNARVVCLRERRASWARAERASPAINAGEVVVLGVEDVGLLGRLLQGWPL